MSKLYELTKRDACSTLELINECLTCNDLDHFRQLITKLGKIISFEFATCLICKKAENGQIKPLNIVNVNYPLEWIELYVANDYKQIDPILKINFQDFRLQYWSDTYRELPPPKKFLSTAQDFGLRRGYTNGVRNYTGDEGSLFSFSGPSLEHCARTETLLTAVIPHLHQAFCRAVKYGQIRNGSVLSRREKEILNWMSQGKTSWEISIILHISERTVHFHAQNIIRKLNASNRVHAVAIALEERIIEPVETIP